MLLAAPTPAELTPLFISLAWYWAARDPAVSVLVDATRVAATQLYTQQQKRPRAVALAKFSPQMK